MPSRSVPRLLLACLSVLLGCGTGDGNSLESVELKAVVQSTGPSPVVTLEYTVHCIVDDSSGVSEQMRFEGTLAPADSRGAKGMLDITRVTWQALVDLPSGWCSIQLRGRDMDGEVVCSDEAPFSVGADTAAQLIFPLECAWAGYPSNEDFNICPELRAFRCDERDPLTGNARCVVSFRDEDQSCNPGCDPQSCTTSPQGLTCTPGPDRGVSTIITCDDAVLDCTGDGIVDPSCTIDSDTPGLTSEVDDTLVADFFVVCGPPQTAGAPASIVTCNAVTSDGDIDCNKTKVITVNCLEPSP